MSTTAAVLWTGGKDCALALFKAQKKGYNITHLVTFTPENPDFKAHNLSLIQQQVAAIGLPHLLLTVKAPMQESYENNIATLKKQYKIDTLITGDIDEVQNHDNWIEKCCQKSGMLVYNPLWKKDRNELLHQLINENFKIIFSLVKKPFFDQKWVGKVIDSTIIEELKKLNIDICGENGEYHTMVLNAPYFSKELEIDSYTITEHEHYFYLNKQLTTS
ncbi:diphthine--ammonia ligase [uncultured Tenacibaculum sp.]|uniref:Dph6-related ATP pyrophosphatase n=1 Tax=uncultured Tenacibaculum sp. TaxID=174713 RepID=UPI00260A2183|nr:diphthine--ammonia ligase [uncultured Tenacibaculum sp.]